MMEVVVDMTEYQSTFSTLLVDDEEEFAHMLQVALIRAGYRVQTASRARDALDLLQHEHFDFVVSDIRMPGMDGLEMLERVQTTVPGVTVIMMTAFGTHDTAIEAMKRGAYDYISKPFKPDELVLVLQKAEERERLKRENKRLREVLEKGADSFEGMIGRSPAMGRVYDLVRRVAAIKSTVLVTGESGTGKELVAGAVHRLSPRNVREFVAVNCAAIPANLLESELFGYVRGAFTDAVRTRPGLFEEASGGTLFLDEIGEMPVDLQIKLLRVLEEGAVRRLGDSKTVPVDTRVIAATAKDLKAECRTGRFREDLFFRINVLPIKVPPLRERREDIPLLVRHFTARSAASAGKVPPSVSPEAMRRLLDYDWPGNVRELENTIERAVVLADGPVISTEQLPDEAFSAAVPGNADAGAPDEGGLSLKVSTERLEREFIARALRFTGGNRTRAAELLEISLRSLVYKIKEYGLEGAGRELPGK
jgi:two-component system response regulator AtoC